MDGILATTTYFVGAALYRRLACACESEGALQGTRFLNSRPLPFMDRPVAVTDLQALAPTVRGLVEATLARFIPSEPTTQRFHREWSGGWRVRVEIGHPVRGRLDFVLFHTPEGSIVALPHPMPAAWRASGGISAADGSLWTITDDGDVVRC